MIDFLLSATLLFVALIGFFSATDAVVCINKNKPRNGRLDVIGECFFVALCSSGLVKAALVVVSAFWGMQ